MRRFQGYFFENKDSNGDEIGNNNIFVVAVFVFTKC